MLPTQEHDHTSYSLSPYAAVADFSGAAEVQNHHRGGGGGQTSSPARSSRSRGSSLSMSNSCRVVEISNLLND
jgi:hypothetical protein